MGQTIPYNFKQNFETMEQGTVNERIAKMVEHFHRGNKSAFAKAAGISNQSLGEIVGARQSAPSFAALQKILTAFPEVSISWLVMGEGTMLPEEHVSELIEPDDPEAYNAKVTYTPFIPPGFFDEYNKRREEELAQAAREREQRENDRVIIRALVDHLAKTDKSEEILQIQALLPSVLSKDTDPGLDDETDPFQYEEDYPSE
jgi:hypothetical protein